ncbi:hypothetical protein [Streptosporangium sp. NPDC049046]|uniref:hypothetical protein n=1 Tax=Streptosporangium sp. NPDC049046 TaxID=3155031 RepID=UPI00342E1662
MQRADLLGKTEKIMFEGERRHMISLKHGMGSLLVAAAVVAGIGAAAAPAGAVAGAATALGWEYVATYPGTSAGASKCRADGKLWGGSYECRYYAKGWNGNPKYELWILK